MAWAGVAVETDLGANQARIDGISLAGGASGTIGNAGSGADIELVAGMPAIDADTKIQIDRKSAPAGGSPIVYWAQAAGVLTFTNSDGVNATGTLAIWVNRVHSPVR